MKTLLLVLTTIFFTINLSASTNISGVLNNDKLCKLFTEKVKDYKVKTEHRKDIYAIKTLESYEKRANIYCSK